MSSESESKLSSENDSSINNSSLSVEEKDATKKITSRKRAYSPASINSITVQSDSEGSTYSGKVYV